MATFDTILVGVDFGPLSDVALTAAVSLADRLGAKTIELVHVMELFPYVYSPAEATGPTLAITWDALRSDAAKHLEAHPVPKTSAQVVRTIRVGSPARELAAEATDKSADLIIIASHDRGAVQRIVLGSVANALLRTAPCPVWVVGKDRPSTMPLKRVLAAIDLSPISPRILGTAMRVAESQHAALTVLSLYEGPLFVHGRPLQLASPEDLAPVEAAYRARVESIVNPLRPQGLDVRIEVMRKGPAHNAILDVAELLPADLIVLGTSGHNAWQRFFVGSTATRVVSGAHCPVLCVPHLEHAAERMPRRVA